MNREFEYCPDCGARLPHGGWPKKCTECGRRHFLNPAPVAVLLQPIDGGVLTVRRAIEPHSGSLALPGGFIDLDESWQEAAARELHEETAMTIEPQSVELFGVESAPDGTVLIFGVAPEATTDAIADFEPSFEVDELVVVREHRELAFSLHTQTLGRWFRAQ